MNKAFAIALLIAVLFLGLTPTNVSQNNSGQKEVDDIKEYKPVIYLYPETEIDVEVNLDYEGKLTHIYPAFNGEGNTWNVTAKPDGSLFDKKTKRRYKYLFWEGERKRNWEFENGFVVRDSDIIPFLEEKLEILGLNHPEINDFITYWYPILSQNEYNLIRFEGESYTKAAKLNINPKPDSIIRVFMLAQKIDKPVNIPKQYLKSPTRTGFTVVEWGGAIVGEN